MFDHRLAQRQKPARIAKNRWYEHIIWEDGKIGSKKEED